MFRRLRERERDFGDKLRERKTARSGAAPSRGDDSEPTEEKIRFSGCVMRLSFRLSPRSFFRFLCIV